MSLATAPLPNDPIALRVFAESLQAAMAREMSARDAEIYEKTLMIEISGCEFCHLLNSLYYMR
jgi:hypothetical protein